MSNEVAIPNQVTEYQRNQIINMLISGEFPVDADIARRVGVRAKVVTDLLKADPELVELRRQSELEMAQRIEKSSVDLAIGGRNEIARQKAQEFLLKKMMPEKYGDDAGKPTEVIGKRVNIFLKLPEVQTNADGIPIAKSESPLAENNTIHEIQLKREIVNVG